MTATGAGVAGYARRLCYTRLFAAGVTFLSRRRYVDDSARKGDEKIEKSPCRANLTRACEYTRITTIDKEHNFLPTREKEADGEPSCAVLRRYAAVPFRSRLLQRAERGGCCNRDFLRPGPSSARRTYVRYVVRMCADHYYRLASLKSLHGWRIAAFTRTYARTRERAAAVPRRIAHVSVNNMCIYRQRR